MHRNLTQMLGGINMNSNSKIKGLGIIALSQRQPLIHAL